MAPARLGTGLRRPISTRHTRLAAHDRGRGRGLLLDPRLRAAGLKIRREGDTRAVSTRVYVLRDAGFVPWLAYGLALGGAPLVVLDMSAGLTSPSPGVTFVPG